MFMTVHHDTGVFVISCNSPDASQFVQDSEECRKCLWKAADGSCEYMQVSGGMDLSGGFTNTFTKGQSAIRILGLHAQTVVGYNDDWILDLFGFGDPAHFEQGAFILKNSWGSWMFGHSVDYLSGRISMIEERNLCPNVFGMCVDIYLND